MNIKLRPAVLDRSFTRIFAAAIACVSAHAANLTWDITPGTIGTGDSAITGGAGTWDLTNGNWTTDGGANNIAWTDGNSAIFQGTAGVVTLGAPISANAITFNSAHTITGGTLTLGSATPTITGNGVLGVISAVVAGTNGLSLTATGTAGVYLDGANTYSGVTTVNSGFLVARNNSALGSSADGTVVASGGTLQLENLGGVDTVISNEALTISGTGMLGNRGALASWTGNNTWGGSVTMAANSSVFVNAGTLAINGVVGGTGFNLSKTGAGQLTLGGAASNTYTGTTIVDNGNLVLAKTGGAFAIVGNVQMGNGTANQPNLRMGGNEQFGPGVVMTFANPAGQFTRFDLLGTTQTLAGISNTTGTGVIQNGGIGVGSASNATLTLNTAANFSYNGYLRNFDNVNSGGTLNVVKIGTGKQTFAGANVNYTGTTTVSQGTLALSMTTNFNSATTVAAGAALELNDTGNFGQGPAGATVALGGNLDRTGGVGWLVWTGKVSPTAATAAINLKNAGANAGTGLGWLFLDGGLGSSGAQTLTINHTLADGTTPNNNLATVLRNNNSTYTGAITVNNGSLVIAGGVALGTQLANTAVTLNNATLQFATVFASTQNTANNLQSIAGTGTVSLGSSTLNIGLNDASSTFAGNVTGSGGIAKTGAGNLALSGNGVAYTGGTTVNAGTMSLTDSRLVAGAKTVAAGATLEINSSIPFATRWNNSGTISGAGTINKTGAGVFGTTGAVNFSGTINILGGRLHNDNVTGNWSGSTADVNISAGAVLDLRANDIYVDELNGLGEIWNSQPAGGGDVLFVGVANGSSTYGGNILGNASQAADSPNGAVLSLTKRGTGTFTLTGAGNIYSGATTVENGIVRISGGDNRLPAATNLTVNGGATFGGTFDLNGLNQTVSALSGAAGTVPGTVIGNGILTVNGAVATTFAGNITGTTSLTRAGTGVTALTGASTFSGPTLITGGAIREAAAGSLSPNSNIQFNGGVLEAGFADFALTTGTGGAQVQWLGNGGFAAFGAPRNVSVDGGGTLTWNSGSFVPTGSKLLFGSSAADNTATLVNNLDLAGANRTVEVIGGPAAIEGALAGTVSNGTLTVRGTSGSLALTGQATADVVVDNSNAASTNIMNLLLNRAGGNAIAGGLRIGATDSGQWATVRLGANDQIADTTVVNFGAVSGSWSYLNLNGFNETVAGLSSLPGKDGGVLQLVEGDVSPATNSTLTINVASGTQNYFGHIRDRGNGPTNDPGGNGRLGIVKEGAGTQELVTWNTQVWTGPTTVNNGTLRLGLGGSTGGGGTLSSATTIAAGATLDVTNASNRNWWWHNGGITGAGNVVKSGDSIVNLIGATVNYTGTTTVNSGILRLTDATAFASNVTVNAGAWLEENRTTGSGNLAISMTGAGGYIKQGAGETIIPTPVSIAQVALRAGLLTAGADNVFTSATTLSQGGNSSQTFKLNGTTQTVGGLGGQYDFGNRILGGSPTLSSLTVNIAAGQQTFYGGKIGDVGTDENNLGITKTGGGTLVLSGTGSYTGGTVIAGGTLQLGASTTMPVNLANLGIWLDGADPEADGSAPADGTPISVWKNKGTLGATGDFSAVVGREPSYGAAGAGLMNGNPTVRFTADAVVGFGNQTNYDRLTNPINLANGPSTIIVAGRYAGATVDERKRLVSGLANNYLLGWWDNGENTAYYQNGFAPGKAAGTTNPHVYTSVMRGDGIGETYGNALGRMGALGNAFGPNGLALGGGNTSGVQEYSTGDIGELIIAPVAMSDADRGAIEAYLVRKWTGFMPANPLPTTGTLSLTASGATLNINGVTQTTGSISGVAGTSIALGGGSLTAGNDNGTAQFDGIISGAGNLAKTGTGTWTLGGANTYSAVTRVQNGTLELSGGADRLPTSTTVTLGSSTTSGTLKLNGNNQTVAGLSSTTSPAGANSRIINGSPTAAVLTLNIASGTNNYSGKLGGSTPDENNLGFVKQGTGTLVLGQSSTYTGSTVISGGTVQLGGARALPTSAAVWLDATDGGTINTSAGVITSVTNKGTLGASGNFTAPAGNEPSLAFEASMGGNQVIRFDALTPAGNDQLNNGLNFANDVTVAYIGRLAGTSNQRLLSASGNNWLLGPWGGNGETAFFNNGFLYNGGLASTDTLPRFHIGTIAANGAAAYYSNGTLLGTGSGVGPSSLRLGGGYLANGTEFASGDIGELFVFNGVLSDAQRTQLDSYIARKWFGLGNTDVLPATTAVSLSGGSTLDVNGVNQTIASLAGDAGTTVALGSGTLTVGNATSTTFSGAISGSGTLSKIGSGTLTLDGISAIIGNAYVQVGTLNVTGTLGASLIEVQNGGTLGGNGSIGADVYVLGGGKLSPGTSPGTLTVTGTTLDFSDAVNATNTQSLVFELGTASDRVNLTTGQFGIGTGVLEFDDFAFSAGSGFGPGTYTLFDSTQDVFGTLGSSLSGTVGGFSATIALADTNNDIVLNVVPEPGSATLLLGGLAMLAGRRRRKA